MTNLALSLFFSFDFMFFDGADESAKFKSNQITNMQEKIDELHKKLWIADVYIRLKTTDSFEIPAWK